MTSSPRASAPTGYSPTRSGRLSSASASQPNVASQCEAMNSSVVAAAKPLRIS